MIEKTFLAMKNIIAGAIKIGNSGQICWYWRGIGEHTTEEDIRQKHDLLKRKINKSKERSIYIYD